MSINFFPVLAIFGPETWLIVAVAGAVLIFGADKLPKLARSAGQAKKEFLVGQAEADLAAEKAREDARRQAAVNANAANLTPSATGVATPIPDPTTGTTQTTTAPPV
jgi:sec-independent protein translocase protein TatA